MERRLSRAGLGSACGLVPAGRLGAPARLVPAARLRAAAELGGALRRSALRSVPSAPLRVAVRHPGRHPEDRVPTSVVMNPETCLAAALPIVER